MFDVIFCSFLKYYLRTSLIRTAIRILFPTTSRDRMADGSVGQGCTVIGFPIASSGSVTFLVCCSSVRVVFVFRLSLLI